MTRTSAVVDNGWLGALGWPPGRHFQPMIKGSSFHGMLHEAAGAEARDGLTAHERRQREIRERQRQRQLDREAARAAQEQVLLRRKEESRKWHNEQYLNDMEERQAAAERAHARVIKAELEATHAAALREARPPSGGVGGRSWVTRASHVEEMASTLSQGGAAAAGVAGRRPPPAPSVLTMHRTMPLAVVHQMRVEDTIREAGVEQEPLPPEPERRMPALLIGRRQLPKEAPREPDTRGLDALDRLMGTEPEAGAEAGGGDGEAKATDALATTSPPPPEPDPDETPPRTGPHATVTAPTPSGERPGTAPPPSSGARAESLPRAGLPAHRGGRRDRTQSARRRRSLQPASAGRARSVVDGVERPDSGVLSPMDAATTERTVREEGDEEGRGEEQDGTENGEERNDEEAKGERDGGGAGNGGDKVVGSGVGAAAEGKRARMHAVERAQRERIRQRREAEKRRREEAARERVALEEWHRQQREAEWEMAVMTPPMRVHPALGQTRAKEWWSARAGDYAQCVEGRDSVHPACRDRLLDPAMARPLGPLPSVDVTHIGPEDAALTTLRDELLQNPNVAQVEGVCGKEYRRLKATVLARKRRRAAVSRRADAQRRGLEGGDEHWSPQSAWPDTEVVLRVPPLVATGDAGSGPVAIAVEASAVVPVRALHPACAVTRRRGGAAAVRLSPGAGWEELQQDVEELCRDVAVAVEDGAARELAMAGVDAGDKAAVAAHTAHAPPASAAAQVKGVHASHAVLQGPAWRAVQRRLRAEGKRGEAARRVRRRGEREASRAVAGKGGDGGGPPQGRLAGGAGGSAAAVGADSDSDGGWSEGSDFNIGQSAEAEWRAQEAALREEESRSRAEAKLRGALSSARLAVLVLTGGDMLTGGAILWRCSRAVHRQVQRLRDPTRAQDDAGSAEEEGATVTSLLGLSEAHLRALPAVHALLDASLDRCCAVLDEDGDASPPNRALAAWRGLDHGHRLRLLSLAHRAAAAGYPKLGDWVLRRALDSRGVAVRGDGEEEEGKSGSSQGADAETLLTFLAAPCTWERGHRALPAPRDWADSSAAPAIPPGLRVGGDAIAAYPRFDDPRCINPAWVGAVRGKVWPQQEEAEAASRTGSKTATPPARGGTAARQSPSPQRRAYCLVCGAARPVPGAYAGHSLEGHPAPHYYSHSLQQAVHAAGTRLSRLRGARKPGPRQRRRRRAIPRRCLPLRARTPAGGRGQRSSSHRAPPHREAPARVRRRAAARWRWPAYAPRPGSRATCGTLRWCARRPLTCTDARQGGLYTLTTALVG